ncbi:MAG: SET domain-containing protein [Candidatus Paceibacterota bacterium]|jgi:SET domain-containing protein
MFYKKTYLDKSLIEGIGLFSGEDIIKGELVYKHSPRFQHILSPEELESLPKDEKDTFAHYGYLWQGKWYLDFDDVRFLNHATEPNLVLADEGIVATRDIVKGEELTQDYKDFEDQIRF